MAYTVIVSTPTASSAYGAATLEAAGAKAASLTQFYTEAGHTAITSAVTLDCEPCHGSGAIRSKRQKPWETGKACKACGGSGSLPL